MDTLLNSSLRDEVGSNACNRIRSIGHIPGIIYGHNFENYSLEFDARDIRKLVRNYGDNAMVNISINGTEYPAMIKEVQRDLLTGEVIHVDLQQVNATEKIHTTIPVVLNGREVVGNNGILQQQIQKVEVECYPTNIPKYFSLDVSSLGVGGSLKISDVEFGEEIAILNDPEQVIVSLSAVKEEMVDDEEDDISNDMIREKVEPEVIGEKKEGN